MKLVQTILSAVALLLFFSVNLQAQNKEVKVKVIKNGEVKDSCLHEDILIVEVDGAVKRINIDSIVHEHTKDIDKHMKIMAFHMDSLSDMDINFEGDMEKMHIEIERMLKEKGIAMEELEKIHMEKANNLIFISEDGDHTVDVETIVNEDGEHVKIIKKKIQVEHSDEDGGHKTYIIKSGDKHPMRWHAKHHKAMVKVESISLDEIAFLKKAGVSTKKLMGDPLDVEEFKIKLEKKIENEIKQTFLHIECQLPAKGEYEMEVLKKDGSALTKESNIPAGELKKEFELKDQEAPYYFILTQNNKLFGRKVIL